MIDVILVDDYTIKVDPRSILIKGGWVSDINNCRYIPNDVAAVELCNNLLSNIENPVMIDIGANVGCFSLLSILHKNMTCISFEPLQSLYDIMTNNLTINDVGDNVKLFRIGISNEDGDAIIKCPLIMSLLGLTTIGVPHRYKHWTEESIKICKLDGFIKTMLSTSQIQKIDIIKIDIEGCELNAIKGAVDTINKFKPHIICECTPKNTCQFGYELSEIFNLMNELGYESKWISKDDVHFFPIQKCSNHCNGDVLRLDSNNND